jgi:hypothetical protein
MQPLSEVILLQAVKRVIAARIRVVFLMAGHFRSMTGKWAEALHCGTRERRNDVDAGDGAGNQNIDIFGR